MTRSSGSPLLQFDLEIERSLHFANRVRRLTFSSAEPEHTQESVPLQLDFDCSSLVHSSSVNMATQDNRTLKQLGAPSVNNEQPLCIRYPAVNNDAPSFELKSGLIHLLPKFHGLAGEDPHKHLKEFHVVCCTMKPQGVTEEQIKLRAFPFFLESGAKDWLYYLQPSSIGTWNEMARLFIEKYFPSSRATTIRKEISGIRQGSGENLHEYWERFKRLCASCPHHQIPDSLLIVYFYKWLLPIDRNLIDAASGGAFSDKTSVQAKELIANMVANAQQLGTRANNSAVYQVQGSPSQPSIAFTAPAALGTDQQHIENILDELATMVRQLAVVQTQSSSMQPSHCGICDEPSHSTDACFSFGQDIASSVDQSVVAVFPGRPQYQQQNDPFSNTYNPVWKNHPNFKWNQNQQNVPYQNQQVSFQQQRQFVPQHQRQQTMPQQQQQQQYSRCSSSLEDLVKQMAASNLLFQQRTESTIQNLQTQIGQLATSMVQPQNNNALPSQTIPNPKGGGHGNVSAITLRSGKQLEESNQVAVELSKKDDTSSKEQEMDTSDIHIPLAFPQRRT